MSPANPELGNSYNLLVISSPVDSMPNTMLKSNVCIMAPLITRLANMSFSTETR